MKTLYIGLLGLLIAGIVTTVVLLLRRHNKSSDPCANAPAGPVGSPCHWSDQQKNDMINTMAKSQTQMPFGQTLNTCLINQLSAKYSYATASDPNFNPTEAEMKPIFSPCFGQKGNWTSDFTTLISSQMVKSGATPQCSSCAISAMEAAYDPMDLMDLLNAPKPPPGTTPPDPIGDVIKASCSLQCGHPEGFQGEGFCGEDYRKRAQPLPRRQGYCGSC